MLEKIKNAGISFYLCSIACLLATAGVIVMLISINTQGYTIIASGMVTLFGILVIVANLAGIAATVFFGNQNVLAAFFKLAVVGLVIAIIGIVVVERIDMIGALFTWDSDNVIARGVFNTTVAGAALMLVAVIILIVNSFFDKKAA